MNRPGYNPTRRNRNIGTDKSGHGQNNRLVIPDSWADTHIYYERLVNPVSVPITVKSVKLNVLVEPTTEDFAHACSIDDIIYMLNLMPTKHFQDIKIIILRQPKRKERILSPVWGRLAYLSEIGIHSGPAIYLESQNINRQAKWHKSMSPDVSAEFERLQEDGHSISFDKRNYLIASTLDSVRNTQLYRTLPHEIGHCVDYLQSVKEPGGDDYDKKWMLMEKYDQKPKLEKESFAHRYADTFREKMTREGKIPFKRLINKEDLEKYGLKSEWFGIK